MANKGLTEKVVALAKRRGFVYPSSEVYGGFGGFWDFGPNGVELKKNIKKLWWEDVVYNRDEIVGVDSSVILNPKVWEASGHTGSGFADPLRECKRCHHRFRGDDLRGDECPDCEGELTEEKKFNILVKTFIGSVEDKLTTAYLRGETCQGIFLNFKNIVDTFWLKIPFGIAQIGKAFRNEITPGNFIFRSREFEMMELEYFVKPGKDEKIFDYWVEQRMRWLEGIGVKNINLRLYEHPKDKLAHYSKKTVDIEYRFPFGWGELEGIANRADFDLKNHSKFCGKDLSFKDQESGESFIPYVVEPSIGVERLFLVLLLEAYCEEGEGKDERVVLKLDNRLAPVKIAVFPLLANKKEIVDKARKVYEELKRGLGRFNISWDEIGNIGKRYRRQDEIGTPWCVTIDYDTLDNETVTIRDRDTMKQERVKIDELVSYFQAKLV